MSYWKKGFCSMRCIKSCKDALDIMARCRHEFSSQSALLQGPRPYCKRAFKFVFWYDSRSVQTVSIVCKHQGQNPHVCIIPWLDLSFLWSSKTRSAARGAFVKFPHGFPAMIIPTLAQFLPLERESLRFSHTQEGILPRGYVVYPPCAGAPLISLVNV